MTKPDKGIFRRIREIYLMLSMTFLRYHQSRMLNGNSFVKTVSDVKKLLACCITIACRGWWQNDLKRQGAVFRERRIENNIKVPRGHLSKLEEVKKGNYGLSDTDNIITNKKYNIDPVGNIHVICQLKLKIHIGSLTTGYCQSQVKQFQKKKLYFKTFAVT